MSYRRIRYTGDAGDDGIEGRSYADSNLTVLGTSSFAMPCSFAMPLSISAPSTTAQEPAIGMLLGAADSNATECGIFAPEEGLAFSMAGVERMRLTDAGFLGVGTQTPRGVLDVRGGEAYIGDTLKVGQEPTREPVPGMYLYAAAYIPGTNDPVQNHCGELIRIQISTDMVRLHDTWIYETTSVGEYYFLPPENIPLDEFVLYTTLDSGSTYYMQDVIDNGGIRIFRYNKAGTKVNRPIFISIYRITTISVIDEKTICFANARYDGTSAVVSNHTSMNKGIASGTSQSNDRSVFNITKISTGEYELFPPIGTLRSQFDVHVLLGNNTSDLNISLRTVANNSVRMFSKDSVGSADVPFNIVIYERIQDTAPLAKKNNVFLYATARVSDSGTLGNNQNGQNFGVVQGSTRVSDAWAVQRTATGRFQFLPPSNASLSEFTFHYFYDDAQKGQLACYPSGTSEMVEVVVRSGGTDVDRGFNVVINRIVNDTSDLGRASYVAGAGADLSLSGSSSSYNNNNFGIVYSSTIGQLSDTFAYTDDTVTYGLILQPPLRTSFDEYSILVDPRTSANFTFVESLSSSSDTRLYLRNRSKSDNSELVLGRADFDIFRTATVSAVHSGISPSSGVVHFAGGKFTKATQEVESNAFGVRNHVVRNTLGVQLENTFVVDDVIETDRYRLRCPYGRFMNEFVISVTAASSQSGIHIYDLSDTSCVILTKDGLSNVQKDFHITVFEVRKSRPDRGAALFGGTLIDLSLNHKPNLTRHDFNIIQSSTRLEDAFTYEGDGGDGVWLRPPLGRVLSEFSIFIVNSVSQLYTYFEAIDDTSMKVRGTDPSGVPKPGGFHLTIWENDPLAPKLESKWLLDAQGGITNTAGTLRLHGDVEMNGKLSRMPISPPFYFQQRSPADVYYNGSVISLPSSSNGYYCIKFNTTESYGWILEYKSDYRILIPYDGVYIFKFNSMVLLNTSGQFEPFISSRDANGGDDLNNQEFTLIGSTMVSSTTYGRVLQSAPAYLTAGQIIKFGFYSGGGVDSIQERTSVSGCLIHRTS